MGEINVTVVAVVFLDRSMRGHRQINMRETYRHDRTRVNAVVEDKKRARRTRVDLHVLYFKRVNVPTSSIVLNAHQSCMHVQHEHADIDFGARCDKY